MSEAHRSLRLSERSCPLARATLATSLLLTGTTALAQSPTYRDVQFGEKTYHLPAVGYRMWVQSYDKVREHAAFGFSAIAPAIAPATSDPEEAATWGKGTGWHRQIQILVEYGNTFVSQQKQIENAFDNTESMRRAEDSLQRQGRPVVHSRLLDQGNFITLPDGCKRYQGYALTGDEIRICDDAGAPLLAICDSRTSMPLVGGGTWTRSPYCRVMENADEKTRLTYSFSYDYADKVLQIHRDLLALLKSFRTPATHP